MSENHEFFLSRQPVVGTDRRFMGWELVLGSLAGRNLSRDGQAKEEYANAFEGLAAMKSWDTILCGGRAVLRGDRSLLYSDAMGALPRNKILLALPAEFEIDAQVSTRLHTLHRQQGIRLLFDDYVRRDPREEVLDLADMVHVDTRVGDEQSQGTLVRRAKRRDLGVLARGVEREADFEKLRGVGFEYFLGPHYADEGVGDESKANVDGQMLLRLMLDARAGLDIGEVAQQIEDNAQLKEGLLKLVNSLELARAQKIESIHQALILIGVDGLGRWLNLLLFRYGAAGGERGPLFRVAASRARLLELLMTGGMVEDPARKADGETAFLVGMLSFVHVLLGVDRASAVENFALPQELHDALIGYRGPLGRMLWLAENLDAARFVEVSEGVAELGIEPSRLWRCQEDAYAWVYRMA